MARYIDADVLKEELKMLTIFVTGMLCGKTYLTEVVTEYKKSLFKLIDEQPDADVVSRSEVIRWRLQLKAVLEEIPETKREVAREIFEEVENIIRKHNECPEYRLMIDLAKLKKKYTEGEK